MDLEGGSPELDVPVQDAAAYFDQLQRKLTPLWAMIGRSDPGGPLEEDNTIVVVPSLTVDLELSAAVQQAYEERFLFMLFLLRQPRIRLIYLSSEAIDREIVDYYLHVLPGVVPSSARKRLFMLSPRDSSSRPLTRKLLDRPRLLHKIRALIPDLDRAHVVPFNTTDLERELAVRLGIPMYAADPRFEALGTKSGGRRIFTEEGIPHALGYEDLRSADQIASAIMRMRAQRPSLRRVIVKLNQGVSGMGNAVVELAGAPTPGDPAEHGALLDRLRAMRYEAAHATYETYIAQVQAGGAVAEELIEGAALQSPSVQLRVTPLGDVELLSTHDQILGGPSGQSYLGARFPANPAYAVAIAQAAARAGARLAKEGVIGRFALDFVVVQGTDGAWQPYAIEINLRKGGTTAPFLTLQYLTDGRYDPTTGVFTTAQGRSKCYVSSDHVEAPRYRDLTPADLLDLVSRERLHFDHSRQAGVVLHMFSGVAALGRFGVTAIADSPGEADALYARLVDALDHETRR